MERDIWIKNVLNSTNGMIKVTPSDDLFSRIQQKINKQKTVSSKMVWLVAASIVILILLNFSIIITANKEKITTSAYFENTLNKSNQLY